MLQAVLGGGAAEPLRILCLGAHSDDIEIGCGGTLLKLLALRPGSTVDWVVFSANDEREAEARRSAAAFLEAARTSHVAVHRFRESYFPSVADQIKDTFEVLKNETRPDLIFTHRRGDAHQDHRVVGELTWNTFRQHLIAEYEIPKYEGDLGQPNAFVSLPAEVVERKIALLLEHFGTQRSKNWFRAELFNGVMALRGIESASSDGYAEGFYMRKVVIQ
jgi:LmbE family N-acetylglucosaminyl deacetylase